MNNNLSKFLNAEILLQKQLEKPDRHYILMLQRLLDKGEMTKRDFINTGRIMDVNSYRMNYGVQMPIWGAAPIGKDTKDVVRYAGGFCIQALPNQEGWLFNSNDANEGDEVSTMFRANSLPEVESFMWKHYVEKLIK